MKDSLRIPLTALIFAALFALGARLDGLSLRACHAPQGGLLSGAMR